MLKPTIYLLFCAVISCASPAKKENPLISNGDVQLAYTSSGKSDTTLLFVHGWSINKEFWQDQVDYFSKRYHVVTMDLGGHGTSGKNRNSWTIDDYSNDVIAVIKGLGLEKVIIIGHSMSGDIMLDAIKKYPKPFIGMVGIDNLTDIQSGPLTADQQKEVDQWFLALEKNFDSTATAYCRSGLFPPGYPDTISINRVIASVVNMDPFIASATLKSLLQFSPNEAAILPTINLPLHLVKSSGTPLNEESLKKYCKAGYTIKNIQGTGHYPMIEKPGEFNRALEETLDNL